MTSEKPSPSPCDFQQNSGNGPLETATPCPISHTDQPAAGPVSPSCAQQTPAPPARVKFAGVVQGIAVVDKPLGWSSMQVIRKVRRATNVKRVGHAGTLDPLATGVVVVCIGKATKLVDRIMGQTKVYQAQIDLSAFTETDDLESPLQEVEVLSPPTLPEVEKAVTGFVGDIQQTPPIYSAIHVDGQRAYELARKGKQVNIKPRQVRVDSITIDHYSYPFLDVTITCGKGTYIRSLARDIGVALNTGGHLAKLRRVSVGRFHVDMALPSEKLLGQIDQTDVIALDSPSFAALFDSEPTKPE